MTDADGELYEHVQYFPFGETWVDQRAEIQRVPYLFTGKELDEETGLYYFGARYYDPRTSVWQSPDPIIEKYLDGAVNGVYESSNLAFYTYGRNNPVVLKDPDGNIVGLLIGAWAVFELASAAYDIYNAGATLMDPNATATEKTVAVGGAALSVFAPGGGYGTAGRATAEAVEQGTRVLNRVESTADAATTGRTSLSQLTDEQFVTEVASRAERRVGGTGAAAGTAKHSYAEGLLNRYQRMTGQRQHLQTEQSYLEGVQVPRGMRGSSRPDVYDPASGNVYDYKFTTTPGRGIPAAQRNRNQANLPNVTNQVEINP